MDWPPDFQGELQRRFDLEKSIIEDRTGTLLAAAKAYYAENPVAFVNDCVWVYEPRNANLGLPVKIPTVPFPRQAEYLDWLRERFISRTSAPVEKSRDSGASWMACAFSVWVWLFYPGATAGFGSRVEAAVDKLGDPNTLFEKIRMLIRFMPPYLLPAGFSEKRHSNYMRIVNPEIGSAIIGEGGSQVGRGGRSSIYFVDESAFIMHPKSVNAALSANTECRIDISSCRAGTDFQERCDRTQTPLKFVFDIRDAPWHTEEWIEKKRAEINDEGIFAQEFLRDPTAAIEGQLIPSKWVEAAVSADKILGIEVTGARTAALDVADGGNDRNALTVRHGILVTHCESRAELMADGGGAWGYAIAVREGAEQLRFDSIGVGAGAAAVLRDKPNLKSRGWSAAGAVVNPEGSYPPNARVGSVGVRRNKDMFQNAKSQAWWYLKDRFFKTYTAVQAVKAGLPFPEAIDRDDIISLSPSIPEIRELKSELSQVTYTDNNAGKVVINKSPDGHKSPNRADSVMIAFAPEAPVRVPSVMSIGGLMR